MEKPQRRAPKKFQHRRKFCKFCSEKIPYIDYKELRGLRSYTTERGKILPRRVTGNCALHQRELTVAVNRARNIALLPYIEK